MGPGKWARAEALGKGGCHCKDSADFRLCFVCEVKGPSWQVGKGRKAGRNFHSFLSRKPLPLLCVYTWQATPLRMAQTDTPSLNPSVLSQIPFPAPRKQFLVPGTWAGPSFQERRGRYDEEVGHGNRKGGEVGQNYVIALHLSPFCLYYFFISWHEVSKTFHPLLATLALKYFIHTKVNMNDEKWKSLSCVWLFVTPWTAGRQAPL